MKTATRTLRIGHQVYDLGVQPLIMGILNLTPDSFYEGSRLGLGQVLDIAAQMLADGATILDLGGYSTRPNAADISEQEELDRVLPAIEAINQHLPNAIISIDTFRTSVAKAAVSAGAMMVNDVSGGHADPDMLSYVAAAKVIYVLMHSRGTPATMQSLAQYQDLTNEVVQELRGQLAQLHTLGHYEVLIDPGFGFAKTIDQNYQLLAQLRDLELLGCPILVGLSRKSMAYRPLGITATEALNATTVLHTLALQNGAGMLRVHDVGPAAEAIRIWQLYQRYQRG
jgi:dihydropteroate synthase